MIKDNHGYNQYTKEEIIELAQNWFNEHGRLVQRDLKHSNGLPSSCQVTKQFGTLQNLLKEAGIGIAMENASPKCKDAATFITKHHDKDGVAYGITEFLKI